MAKTDVDIEELRCNDSETSYPDLTDQVQEGSWQAWLQVLMAFLVSFTTHGLQNCFGSFQYHYEAAFPEHSAAGVAWIGTLQCLLASLTGVFSGRAFDRGYFKSLIAVGAILQVSGLVLTSFATSFRVPFLTLGVLVGVGSGIMYTPCMAVLAHWFHDRYPLASGVASTGQCLGGMIYPVLLKNLSETYGFSWTCRGFAIFNACLFSLVFVLAKAKAKAPHYQVEKDDMVDKTATKDVSFWLFATCVFLAVSQVDTPLFYFPELIGERLGTADTWGYYLLAILNSGSLVGSVSLGLFTRSKACIRIWGFSILGCTILLFCWFLLRDLASMITWGLLFGLCDGGMMALLAPALLTISPDRDVVGHRLGIIAVFDGLGYLIGPPVTGALRESAGGYMAVSLFGGGIYASAVSIVALICLRYPGQISTLEKKSLSVSTTSSEASPQ
ncbi:MFS general substrate transporter [Xylariaceae sp. FL0016]|nr:MFS general substrate transporter [Xylariaceae sp. FL0016]